MSRCLALAVNASAGLRELNEEPRGKPREVSDQNLDKSFAASGGEFDPKRLNKVNPVGASPGLTERYSQPDSSDSIKS